MTTTGEAPRREGRRPARPRGGDANASTETTASADAKATAAGPKTTAGDQKANAASSEAPAGASRQRGSRRVRASTETAPRGPTPRIANPLNVGEGILVKMAELSDHPIRDAEFFRNADGSQVEQCWGTKGLYIASSASGSWEVAGPFGGGA